MVLVIHSHLRLVVFLLCGLERSTIFRGCLPQTKQEKNVKGKTLQAKDQEIKEKEREPGE